MIKLIAKKKLGFRNPDTREILTVTPYAFETVPDWVAHDGMFKLALASGTLQLVTDNPQPAGTAEAPKAAAKAATKKTEKKEPEKKEEAAK